TTTEGVDVVGRYRLPTETVGDFDFTVAANFNDVSLDTDLAPGLFGRQRILTIEEGTPDVKVSAGADWRLQKWGASLRATYYGDVLQPGSVAANDYRTGEKTVIDLEGRYQLTDRVGLAVGADNVFDEYPEATPASLNSNGVLGYPYNSPFGFNGRFVYARVNLTW
ncbi:MAG: TonB-dependent receptor domain-containing protein, partial [Brevundimonas mediterranea]